MSGNDYSEEIEDRAYASGYTPPSFPPSLPFELEAPRPVEMPPGTVIGFSKQYTEDGAKYAFVAVHVGRKGWYLTGPNYAGQPMDWDALLDFIGGPDEWAAAMFVSEWSRLIAVRETYHIRQEGTIFQVRRDRDNKIMSVWGDRLSAEEHTGELTR